MMDRNALIIVVRFAVKEGCGEKFLARVHQQAADSLAREPDCHRFDVATAPGDNRQVLLYEIYSDDAAFAEHLRQPHFLAFDAETRDWIDSKSVERWEGPWP